MSELLHGPLSVAHLSQGIAKNSCDTLDFEAFSLQYADLQIQTVIGGVMLFLFVDADNLKTVNDTLGHALGDQLIAAIAATLREGLPDSAVFCRKGGDEFIAALVCEGVEMAEKIAQDVSCALNRPCHILDHEILMSCSIGASVFGAQDSDLMMQLQRSDAAMYWAKSAGKGQVRFFDETAGCEMMRLQELSAQFPKAFTSNELSFEFQPIYHIADRSVVGAEALVRWMNPQYGAISAETIVHLASKSGRMCALNLYILKEACLAAGRWECDAYVSVNFSANDFLRADLAHLVFETLENTGFDSARLRIEITEAERLEQSSVVLSNLQILRNRGIKIGIDDFGTGYSAMSHLDDFPLDFIKVDRSLISQCDTRKSSKIFLNAIRQVAQNLKIEVIAEGLETVDEVAVVRAIGVSYGQGYHFAVPAKPDEFLRYLHQPHYEWFTSRRRAQTINEATNILF